MTKVVNSSEYINDAIFVGCSVNEHGEPLVEVNGKAVGTIDGLLDFIGKYWAPPPSCEGLADLERKIDEVNRTFNRRVIEAVRASSSRNVRLSQ